MDNKIFDKNSTYTAIDITNAVVAATDRYQDFDSARGTVNQMINKLGIKSVNGQKRNRYFTGLDAQRVIEAIPHTKQIPLITVPKSEEVEPRAEQKTKPSKLIELETVDGHVLVQPEDISMICLPPLFYYLTFRGYGTLVTFRSGKRIHVKEDLQQVKRAVKEAMEVGDNDSY